MSVKVLFFASLRERMGSAEQQIEFSNFSTVEDIWCHITLDTKMPETVLCAVNMEFASPQTKIKRGDEVAFFPAVTGG